MIGTTEIVWCGGNKNDIVTDNDWYNDATVISYERFVAVRLVEIMENATDGFHDALIKNETFEIEFLTDDTLADYEQGAAILGFVARHLQNRITNDHMLRNFISVKFN